MTDTKKILKLISDNNLTMNLGGQQRSLKMLVNALRELSDARSKEVRRSVENYAGNKGVLLESSQIRAEGAGVTDPAYPDPRKDPRHQAANRRVVFSIIKVPADKVDSDEFGL